MTQPWPPPGVLPPPPPPGPRRKSARPAFGAVVGVAIAFRLGREIFGRVALSRWGMLGAAALVVAFLAVAVLWRAGQRWRVRARGGVEFTTESVAEQVTASGLGPPAFEEDGTLLGASVLVANQRTKLVEVLTEYELFGVDGRRLGTVRQIGQSGAKKVARVFTGFDQFFTHHFDVVDAAGATVLRLTRPRKVFLSKLHVHDGTDRFLGTIRQRNVLWKIRFDLVDAGGGVIGQLRAENLRAWDFQIVDRYERPVAEVVKSWEGWARTGLTRADRYVVRIGERLPSPARELTVAAALGIDLALKQDARGAW